MDSIGKIIEHAENGNRLKISGKTVWAGLGNRSGLHGFATTLIDEKWEKSGPRFERKMS
ncbi:MAG: hypothetical protein HOE14_19080, partial [Gemmatimonadales bacterium]|nr:hypothetical protein [Gemmatimonadales bacterium]